jgi:hypothetical protein
MAPEPQRIVELARRVSELGLDPRRARAFSMAPADLAGVPVKVSRYRPPVANMVFGGLLGLAGGVVLGVPLLLYGYGWIPLLSLVVLFALGGALSRLWFGQGLAGELYRLDDAMRRGSAALVLKVDRGRAAELGRRIKDLEHEVAVLGADIDGTPPFP